MWWLLGMEKVRDRRWGGREGRTAQEALGIISITPCVFLSSHLFVCLSVSIPLAKPFSTWVNEPGQTGPPFSLHPTPSTPPIHSIPQRCRQKPMTLWGKQPEGSPGSLWVSRASTGAATDQGLGDSPGMAQPPYPAPAPKPGWR